MSLERLAELAKIDNALMIKNDRMGRNARPRLNVVKKNLTGIDEELLKEYQQIKPQTYEYTDPETGETKYRKYQLPDTQVDIKDIAPDPRDLEFIPQQRLNEFMDDLDERRSEIADETVRVQMKLAENFDELNRLNEEMNTAESTLTSRDQFRRKRDELLRERAALNQLLKNLRKEYYDIDIEKERVRTEIAQYNTSVVDRRKRVLERANMYRDELNFLNKGAFSTEQAPNESEMEYLERLQRNAQILAPDDELTDARFMTISRFREKMRELIKDPVKIEAVINSIDGNSSDNVDNKAELLKNWELLKNKFIGVYGVNNKSVTADDILAFFDRFLGEDVTGLANDNPEPSAEETPKSLTATPLLTASSSKARLPSAVKEAIVGESRTNILAGLQIEPMPTENTIALINNLTRKELFLRALTDGVQLFLLYSFTNEPNSYKQYFDKNFPSERKGQRGKSGKSADEIKDKTGIETIQLNTVFGIKDQKSINPSVIAKKITTQYGVPVIQKDDYGVTSRQYSTTKGGDRTNVEYGMGMAGEKMPQYVEFGDVIILLKKLFYDNLLSVRNKHMKSIEGLPVKKVSEQLVNIITNMVNNIHPTFAEINALKSPERQLYDRLIRIANLNKTVVHQGEKSVDELKKRLSLVEGELEMGNDNYELLQEIHTILNSLHQLKAITKGQKDKYLNQFTKTVS